MDFVINGVIIMEMSLIAIDARESGTSTGRYVDKLIENIAKLKLEHDFNIITKPHRVEFFKKIAPNFYVHSTDVKEFTVAEQTKFKQEIIDIDADLVHFGMVQQPIFYKGKVVTTIHDLTTVRFTNPSKNFLVFKFKQFVYKWVIRVAADKSSVVFTPSQYVKEDVKKFTNQPDKKFVVTLESADEIREKADPIKKLVGKQFILYVGRPTPHKNLDRLIEAFVALQKKRPELMLVLAGKKDSNYEAIEKRIKANSIDGVYFTDFVSEGQLKWLYKNCRAYIFPSLSEGFGLPGLEAMIHGAPVVSSNATCLPEIHGDAAQYFNPLDLNDMVKNIAKVLDSEELRKELIKKGHKQVKKFSWQRMAEITLSIYDRVLED